MQDLGFVLKGPVVAKAPFNRFSGSEDIHTYLPELVLPRSPLPTIGAQRGRPLGSWGSDP